MDESIKELLPAILGFVGVFAGSVIALIASNRRVGMEAQLKRQSEQKEYLTARMHLLAEATHEYEVFNATGDSDIERHAAIIGKAIAACLSVPDFPDEKNDKPVDFRGLFYKGEKTNIPEVEVSNSPRDVYKIHRLHFIANWRLTPRFVTSDMSNDELNQLSVADLNLADELAILRDITAQVIMWGHYSQRNRHALFQAMNRLSVLIAQVDKR